MTRDQRRWIGLGCWLLVAALIVGSVGFAPLLFFLSGTFGGIALSQTGDSQ